MKFNPFLFITALLLFTIEMSSQSESGVQIGSNSRIHQLQGALFDYSDPESFNIKVAVWGFVKYPGRYIIPGYSTVEDLISYAGGPTDDAELENLIIQSRDTLVNFCKVDYGNLLKERELKSFPVLPALKPGDILLVPGEPRLYFKDWFQIAVSVVSTMISLSILIINIAE